MLAVQQNAQIINPNLPKFSTSARQARILANAAPTIWLKPDSTYFASDSAGKCAAWYDAANPRRFVPLGNNPPTLTALVNSSNSYLTFNGSGSALFDDTLADLLPANGTPGTIVALALNTSGAGTFGGGIVGNQLSSQQFAMYVNGSSGSYNLQGEVGVSGNIVSGTTNINNNAWTTILGSYTGSGAGAIAARNGTTETTNTNTLAVSTAANALKPIIGGYGPLGATSAAKMQIAAVMVASVDLTLAANASILADINAEFASYQALMTAG